MIHSILGGQTATRELFADGFQGEFERALYATYYAASEFDRPSGEELWSALSNVEWLKGDEAIGYSFRAAGDLVAAIMGVGNYMDWYCSARYGVIADSVSRPMALLGWTYRPAEF